MEIQLALIAEGFTAQIFRWKKNQVLKLYRPQFNAVADREYNIMQKLSGCGLSIPNVFDKLEMEGRAGYVMEEIRGPSFLNLIEADTTKGERLSKALGKLHASVHACRVNEKGFPSILDRISLLIQNSDALGEFNRPVWTALQSVRQGEALCHNDFHFGNVLEDSTGLWIIDWNGAGLGDIHADLAKSITLMMNSSAGICFGPIGRARRYDFAAIYLDAYRSEQELDLDLLRRWQIIRAAELVIYDVPFKDELKKYIKSLL